MKYLLDTCTFIWLITGDKHLPNHISDLFKNSNHNFYLSIVSSWEIAVKYGLKQFVFEEDPSILIPQEREKHQIEFLSLKEDEIFYLYKLPKFHRDPFDRALVVQAIMNGMTLITPDQEIKKYPVKTVW